ncbi:MAG: hypothetical protein M3220_04700 [Chloroflexota bacterium]|nr:hypothetical protein [Chloroflexota bacterium]
MVDWQVPEEGEPLPEAAGERRRAPSRWWRYLIPVLLLLLLIAWLAVQWRMRERTEVLREDLTEAIHAEEQQRLFGLEENAGELLIPDPPEAWAEAYLDTFADPEEARPLEVEVEEIDLDGADALVTVRLDGQPQMRYYRLVKRRWRRAPLPEWIWGEERSIEAAGGTMTIQYRARDEEFAQELERDLSHLRRTWPVDTRVRTIRVAPREFGTPLLEREETVITLNSAQLPLQQKEIAGWEAVRLALADSYLDEEIVSREESSLPGAQHLRSAMRLVLVARWSLSPTAYRELREGWQAKVQALEWWRSPFFDSGEVDRDSVPLGALWSARRSDDAIALIVADYLYEQLGAEELSRLAAESTVTSSWDNLFRSHLNLYTVQVEAAVQAWARGEPPAEVTGMEAKPASSPPFEGTVKEVDPEDGSFVVEVAGEASPLRVEAGAASLTGPQGEPLPTGCAGLYREVRIAAGDWVELGEQLRATEIIVRELSPPLVALPEAVAIPEDTIAYLVRSYPAERRRGASEFLGLAPDGALTPLVRLPAGAGPVWTLQKDNSASSHLVLSWRIPNCDQAWIFRYEFERGVTGRWLTGPEWRVSHDLLSIWQARQGSYLLLSRAREADGGSVIPGAWQYSMLENRGPLRLYPLGTAEVDWFPVGWRNDTRQIIFLDPNDSEGQVKLVDPERGEVVEKMRLAPRVPAFGYLSRDGTRFIYQGGWYPGANRDIGVLNLTDGTDRVLLAEPGDEGLWLIYDGSNDESVLVGSGPRAGEWRDINRLSLVPLAPTEAPSLVTELAAGETLGARSPVIGMCSTACDGAVKQRFDCGSRMAQRGACTKGTIPCSRGRVARRGCDCPKGYKNRGQGACGQLSPSADKRDEGAAGVAGGGLRLKSRLGGLRPIVHLRGQGGAGVRRGG